MTATPRRIHRRPPALRYCQRRLESLADIARALRRLFREVEANRVQPNAARAQVQVLQALINTECLVALDARIAALEHGEVAALAEDSHEASLALLGGSLEVPDGRECD